MHLHRLPWPKEALQAVGDQDVTLRVTLSYFVEPNRSAKLAGTAPLRFARSPVRCEDRRRVSKNFGDG
jgi:hypothetical protein